tara:strand:+ start:90 stop:1259 length:1170 start_codon:yes stop_codon:yes gene_type:complete
MAKKILTIANKVIFPTSDGGSMAMSNLAMILQNRNYKIDIVSISKNNKVKNSNQPKKLTINNYITQITFEKNMCFNFNSLITSLFTTNAYQAIRFYDIYIKDYIQKLIDENLYEIIIFESIFSTIYLSKLKINKNTKTILRAHNVEHKIWTDLANNQIIKKIIFLFLSSQIKKNEENIGHFVDFIFTISDFDKKYFSQLFPKKTFNIPVTFRTYKNNIRKIPNSIYHLGAMDWKPNIQGLKWFMSQVLPSLNKENISIYIAGKNMPKYFYNYKNHNTIIESDIKHVETYIKDKEILFVPIFSGSGIRIKILEAMAYGIPVVSTSKGAQGIPYTNEKNILIADDKNEFTMSIIRLIKNKKLAKTIGDNGKKLIESHFSDLVVNEKLNNII